ncbi:hypothetical protein PAPHI01_1677 [Pancytospora philotis]|nr:hypothetical protein PAPHI01_1677 [Pancytospora philotis]
MAGTLRDWQRQSCLGFLEGLTDLKGKIGSPEELKRLLGRLHTAFLRMKRAFAIPAFSVAEPLTPEAAGGDGPAAYYRCGDWQFATLDGAVLGFLDDAFQEIEPSFVGRRVEELPLLCAMYADYATRACDYCGEYLHGPTLETPTGRNEESGYVSAFHLKCRD